MPSDVIISLVYTLHNVHTKQNPLTGHVSKIHAGLTIRKDTVGLDMRDEARLLALLC